MHAKAELLGKESLFAKIKAKLKKYKGKAAVVGYSQSYAVKVHDDLEAFHSNGQALYLSQPAKLLRKDIADVITSRLKAGATIEQALLAGGMYLQGESQLLVPVKTGALRASAFTRLE